MESLIFKGNVVEIFNFYTFSHVDMNTWSVPVCFVLKDTTMLSLQYRHQSSTICVYPNKDDVLTC